MKKLLGVYLFIVCYSISFSAFAAEKFDVLPDLPEPLSSYAIQPASASSITTDNTVLASQSVGQEPNLFTMFLSLIFVVLLIYITGILYTKLNKFGFNTLKNQLGENSNDKPIILSTTHLGNNKSLHVVTLNGKRMLIGSSNNSVNLIKDLGDLTEAERIEYANVEIPNIKIPKIEIPHLSFTNLKTKTHLKNNKQKENDIAQSEEITQNNSNEVNEDINAETIIGSLFEESTQVFDNSQQEVVQNEHSVDPDDFTLYKKYL